MPRIAQASCAVRNSSPSITIMSASRKTSPRPTHCPRTKGQYTAFAAVRQSDSQHMHWTNQHKSTNIVPDERATMRMQVCGPHAGSRTEEKTMTVAAKGLEGVVVATTNISDVFGEEGRLVFRGYEISQLAAKATYEEVAYLLWKGHLPNRAELDELQQIMRSHRTLPDAAMTALRALPKTGGPM